jgi:hypothetical protein
MTPAKPNLTFFVEVELEPLEELFARPEVVPFLAEQGCAISMGLLDLSPRRAAVVRQLESKGIPVTGWLLLDLEDGYWLNADNADRARERWRETAAWAEREDLSLQRIGLDIEFPRSESKAAVQDHRKAFFSMMRRRRPRELVRKAERDYAALVREIRESGRTVEVYQFPQLLDERAAGSTLLRRSLGLVDIAVDAEVYMLYSTYLGRGGAWVYFEDAPCIAVGVTGGGVNAKNPEAYPRFLSRERLVEDLRAASAHTREVYIFSLEGCAERGLLAPIAEIDWEQPTPRLPSEEEGRARKERRRTQWALRAEPLFDLLVPSRRREEPPSR